MEDNKSIIDFSTSNCHLHENIPLFLTLVIYNDKHSTTLCDITLSLKVMKVCAHSYSGSQQPPGYKSLSSHSLLRMLFILVVFDIPSEKRRKHKHEDVSAGVFYGMTTLYGVISDPSHVICYMP